MLGLDLLSHRWAVHPTQEVEAKRESQKLGLYSYKSPTMSNYETFPGNILQGSIPLYPLYRQSSSMGST